MINNDVPTASFILIFVSSNKAGIIRKPPPAPTKKKLQVAAPQLSTLGGFSSSTQWSASPSARKINMPPTGFMSSPGLADYGFRGKKTSLIHDGGAKDTSPALKPPHNLLPVKDSASRFQVCKHEERLNLSKYIVYAEIYLDMSCVVNYI